MYSKKVKEISARLSPIGNETIALYTYKKLTNKELAYRPISQYLHLFLTNTSAKEAHLADIIDALRYMDDNLTGKLKLYINSEVLTQLAKPENLMEQRRNLLERKVTSLINVIDMNVAGNNSLKENIDKPSKKTYAEAVVHVGHSVEGKAAPAAQDSDAETKPEAPRTSVTSLNTNTLSQGVKSGNQDEKNDNVTSKESSLETGSVPDSICIKQYF